MKKIPIHILKFVVLWILVLLPILVILAPASWPPSGAEIVIEATIYGIGFLIASTLTQIHVRNTFKGLAIVLAALYGFILLFYLYAYIN